MVGSILGFSVLQELVVFLLNFNMFVQELLDHFLVWWLGFDSWGYVFSQSRQFFCSAVQQLFGFLKRSVDFNSGLYVCLVVCPGLVDKCDVFGAEILGVLDDVQKLIECIDLGHGWIYSNWLFYENQVNKFVFSNELGLGLGMVTVIRGVEVLERPAGLLGIGVVGVVGVVGVEFVGATRFPRRSLDRWVVVVEAGFGVGVGMVGVGIVVGEFSRKG